MAEFAGDYGTKPRESRWWTSPGEDAVSWLCLEVEDAAHRPVVLAQRLVQVNTGHLTLKHMYRNFLFLVIQAGGIKECEKS
jgi:hypothetical protein